MVPSGRHAAAPAVVIVVAGAIVGDVRSALLLLINRRVMATSSYKRSVSGPKGRGRLAPVLYPALQRLRDEGLVQVEGRPVEAGIACR